jgi:hypothetical protein
MHAARSELVHDLGGGEEHYLNAREAFDAAAVAPLMSDFAQRERGPREQSFAGVFQPAFGRHC